MRPEIDPASSEARDPEREKSKRIARSISLPKKLIFACVVTVGFFVVLEGTLALLGVRPAAHTHDLLVGFSSQVPLMDAVKDDAGQLVLQTAPSKLVWFNPQSFPLKKSANTKRVFCVGGSTTYGRPFADLSSYSGWLRKLLPVVDSSVNWEVINAGGVSYASYRVAAVMEELAQYQPDLFIVYSVHNEFLERRTYEGLFETSPVMRDIDATLQSTRTGSIIRGLISGTGSQAVPATELLPAEVDEILNHSIGPIDYHADDQWHDKVLLHYRLNLERMVAIAREAGAAIVFVTPASNLRDCSPFKSEASGGLSGDATTKVSQYVDQANRAVLAEQFDDALDSCLAALAIDADHAHARYLLGRALFSLARYDEAEDAFKKSVDNDICPLRATSRISKTVRQIAKLKQVPLVDFQTLLRAKCQSEFGHGCIGSDYFLDHVHPTRDVHGQLALWILTELQSQSLVGGRPPGKSDIDLVRSGIEKQIDIDALGNAMRNLAKVLHWSGKFSEAAPRARDAIALLPTDLESRFVLADCLFNMNRSNEAFDQYAQLMMIGDFPRAYLPYGEMLVERERLDESKTYLLKAVVSCREANRPRAYYALGSVHFMLGEFEFAIQALEETFRLYPDDPDTMLLLAEAYTGAGNLSKAVDIMQRVIDLEPNNAAAHVRLGMILLSEKQFTKARQHFESALKIDPDNARVIQAIQTIDQLDR